MLTQLSSRQTDYRWWSTGRPWWCRESIDSLVPSQSTVDCVGVVKYPSKATLEISPETSYIDESRVVEMSSYDI